MLKSFFSLLSFLLLGLSLAQAEPEIIASGTFEGRSDHTVKGGVVIMKTETGHLVVLDKAFHLDGAPDPKLGFGKSGKFVATSQFSKLQKHDGAQIYVLPETISPADFDEFYVWCEKFSVPLGVASIAE